MKKFYPVIVAGYFIGGATEAHALPAQASFEEALQRGHDFAATLKWESPSLVAVCDVAEVEAFFGARKRQMLDESIPHVDLIM